MIEYTKIQKLLLVIIIGLSLLSCENNKVELTQEEYKRLIGDTIKPEYPKEIRPLEFTIKYTIIIIDSCEYVFAETKTGYGGVTLSHKGNCKKCKKDTL